MNLTHAILGLLLPAYLLPAAISPPDVPLTEREQQIVAAAKLAAPAAPRFNGALIVGIRPKTPLIYALSVSGERPMSFAAKNLPDGLKLALQSGVISGSLKQAGDYKFLALAKNSAGEAQTEIEIVAGDTLALTPPLGWNSYDNFGDAVTEAETLANAEWLK
jgi:hypothetical protein